METAGGKNPESNEGNDLKALKTCAKRPRMVAKRGQRSKLQSRVNKFPYQAGASKPEHAGQNTAGSSRFGHRQQPLQQLSFSGARAHEISPEQVLKIIFFMKEVTRQLKLQSMMRWRPDQTIAQHSEQLKQFTQDNQDLEKRLNELNNILKNLDLNKM